MKDSDQLLINATQFLKDAQKAYGKISDDPQSLERENTILNETLENNFKELSAIEDLVPQVQQHAEDLSQEAQRLDSLLTETRNISTNAVRAGKAYANIVTAVDEAHAAAVSGIEAATNASELLSEVTEDTIFSSDTSANLLLDANNAQDRTVDDLRPRLEDAKAKSRPVRSLHEQNEEKLTIIENFLKNPHMHSFNDKLISAGEIATTADNLAQTILDTISFNFNKLSEEKELAQRLPNKLEDARRNISQTEKQIKSVNEKLPEILQTVLELPVKQDRVRRLATDLDEKIKILNQQIALARDVANRIKVGVKFYRNTTLELRNPSNLDDLSTSTYISGYFKTKEPYGLLLYLGNGNGTKLPRTRTVRFLFII